MSKVTTTKEGPGLSSEVFVGMLDQDQLPTCQSPHHSIRHCCPDFPAGTAGSSLPRSLVALLGAHQRSRESREALSLLTCHQKAKVPAAASTADLLSELGNRI